MGHFYLLSDNWNILGIGLIYDTLALLFHYLVYLIAKEARDRDLGVLVAFIYVHRVPYGRR